MGQAIEERVGDDGIAEDVAPLGEAAVGGEDHGALRVAGVDELEEQVGAAAGDRQVADLVQQYCAQHYWTTWGWPQSTLPAATTSTRSSTIASAAAR